MIFDINIFSFFLFFYFSGDQFFLSVVPKQQFIPLEKYITKNPDYVPEINEKGQEMVDSDKVELTRKYSEIGKSNRSSGKFDLKNLDPEITETDETKSQKNDSGKDEKEKEGPIDRKSKRFFSFRKKKEEEDESNVLNEDSSVNDNDLYSEKSSSKGDKSRQNSINLSSFPANNHLNNFVLLATTLPEGKLKLRAGDSDQRLQWVTWLTSAIKNKS